MRSEQDMYNLILETARQDERIRAVVLNGSRANPNAPRDMFQDFDVVFLVTDVASFRDNGDWIQCFGETIIVQMPEDMRDPPPAKDEPYSYLMQFSDGNRIDLWICPLAKFNETARDSLSVLLLDKDGQLEPFHPPSERDYLPKPPTPKAFANCCNEFWWVGPYVAKGLWRGEILYARAMLDQVVREELMKMLAWHIGVRTGFSSNPGKFGKYFQKYLEPELWDCLLQTYTDASYARTWESLFALCRLFRRVAIPLAQVFGYPYPYEDDRRVFAFLEHIRSLPRDALQIYLR